MLPMYVETYDMHLTLTKDQHKKIESLWALKDLPNPIIFSGFRYSKELWVDEDDAEE